MEDKKLKFSSSSSPPLMGPFTRSKSQIYLHCNRSGQARSDSFRINKHHVGLRSEPVGFKSKKKEKTQSKENQINSDSKDSSTDPDDWSSIYIKDLRTRRVFSLANDECRLCIDNLEEEKKESEKSLNSDSLEAKQDMEDENEEMKKSDVGYCSQEKIYNDFPETEANMRSEIGEDGILNEAECVQATPPDADMAEMDNSEKECEKNIGTGGSEEGLQGCNNMDKKIGNSSGPKLGLNQLSRVRVFKAPGSLSYRRLLPYLMDMVQDHSCSPNKAKFSEVPVEKLGTENSSMEVQTGDSLSNGALVSADGLSDSNLTSSKHFADSATLLVDQCCSKSPADGENDKTSIEVSCKDKYFESSNPECSSLVDNSGIRRYSSDTKPLDNGKIGGVVTNYPCNAAEESVQMTPPDAQIKSLAFENVESKVKFDQDFGNPVNGSCHRNNSCLSDKKVDSDSKSKWGLNQCSQLKLFKTRSSFGYRRMRPYLMDIAKDSSGDSGIWKCPKLEKRLQESSPLTSSASDLNEISIDKLNDRSSHIKHDTDLCNLEVCSLQDASNPSSSNELNLTTPVHKIGASVSDSQEQEIQGTENPSENKYEQLDTDHCTNVVSPQVVSGDHLAIVSQELSSKNEEECRTSILQLEIPAKPIEGGCLSQTSFKAGTLNPLGISANGLAKSILKRHPRPRGCRGLCTCLNCASFRLHAERAFEFSKNQMLDAEEVALDLINQLSHVRTALEKVVSGSDDNLIVCIDQVKEACKKASEAEEVAKSRLNQMNYDLDIHCRISGGERPRVRFANNVQKRIFHG